MFKKIITAISGFFSKEAPVLETALTGAISFVNIVKTFMGSAMGVTLQAVADALLPGVAPAVFTALNTFFVDFGLVTKDFTGAPSEMAAAGLNAVSNLTGDSRIHALNSITSIIANKADNANGGTSTPQQTLVAVPVAYNPNVLGTANAILPGGDQVSQTQLNIENSPNGGSGS